MIDKETKTVAVVLDEAVLSRWTTEDSNMFYNTASRQLSLHNSLVENEPFSVVMVPLD
jgi:hypothetical protein